MTVAELAEILSRCPPDAPVMVPARGWGYDDAGQCTRVDVRRYRDPYPYGGTYNTDSRRSALDGPAIGAVVIHGG